MTIQQCCGGIPSNNPDITEGSEPYMIKRCLKTSDWNKTQCNDNCCQGSDKCVPTEQGGYCQNANERKYYRYTEAGSGSDKEKQFLTETEARRQYPYLHESVDTYPYGHEISSRHHFVDRRYDRSYAQAQRDIVNGFMENSILDKETDYKKSTEYLSTSMFTPTMNIIILILVILVAIGIINTVVMRNKMYRFRKLFF